MASMKFRNLFLSASVALLLAACTHQKVTVNRVDDGELSCNDIKDEINQMEKVRSDIDSKTGMSGRNVGMALLFWPGIVVNEINASDAEKLASARMSVLVKLYRHKQCSTGINKVSHTQNK
jgi:hypothetical protein